MKKTWKQITASIAAILLQCTVLPLLLYQLHLSIGWRILGFVLGQLVTIPVLLRAHRYFHQQLPKEPRGA